MTGHGSDPESSRDKSQDPVSLAHRSGTRPQLPPPGETYDSNPGAFRLRPRWNDDDAWAEGRALDREGYD